MRNRMQKLPLVDYNDPNFSALSYNALHKYGAFILTNTPTIAADASMLMKEFRDFTSQPEEIIKPFLAGNGIYELAGYHPYEQHWAARRFSGCYGLVSDGEGKISQPLPTNQFKRSAKSFIVNIRGVANKILDVIGSELNIQNELSNYFSGYSILGMTDSYVPPTQEKINALNACDKLIITEDNRLAAFGPHCDVNPLTIIAYDNNDCTGLEMQLPDEYGNLTYVPIELPEAAPNQVTPLVLVGKPLEILTGGLLRAPKHRVVLEPMKSGEKFHRGLTSAFTLFGPNSKEPQPLIPSNSATNSQQPSKNDFDPSDYFKDIYDQYVEKERNENLRTLPHGLLERFPAESEIERVQSPTKGIMYIRR